MDTRSTQARTANPALMLGQAVEKSLMVAQTWLAWDGRPCVSEDGDRIYTPQKVIRRIGDHVIDHLAEIEALLAAQPTMEYQWHGSLATFDSDYARFTELDMQEAKQRLSRLAQMFELRLAAAGPDEWDRPRSPNWTLREIAHHLADTTTWYTKQVGKL